MSPDPATPTLGRYGIWRPASKTTPELAASLEGFGFGALWLGSSPSADLAVVESILAATEKLVVATGILNILAAEPDQVMSSYHRLEERYPGRFLLGLGASHPERFGPRAAKPYAAMVEYLDQLDLYRVPKERRVLAALGPKMLSLAGLRAAGAHPYLVTPEHTRQARKLLGPDALLVPEQRVALRRTPEKARALLRPTIQSPYLGLQNYVNNWRRLGFEEEDFAEGGSDRLIDVLGVYGDEYEIKRHIDEHLVAGADQVALQLITGEGDDVVRAYQELAIILGARVADR